MNFQTISCRSEQIREHHLHKVHLGVTVLKHAQCLMICKIYRKFVDDPDG